MTPGTAGLVASAMERIEAGALGDGSIEDLARELRVTSRHLRRAIRLDRTEFDGFETAARDIIGERTHLRRFAGALGKPFEARFAPLDRFFPSPEEVARSSERALARLGIRRGQARALLSLAAAAAGDP